MGSHIPGPERRRCPQEFQRRVTRAGGINRYGKPNFDIIWGETATVRTELGTVLQLFGDQCWALRQWNEADRRYDVIQPFRWAGVVNGKLVREFMPLNSVIVDRIIPIIKQCKDVKYWKRYMALRDKKERHEKARADRIEDNLRNARPWTGAVSYAGQRMRTSLIDKKIEGIKKNWDRMMYMQRIARRGHSAFNRPVLN